MSLFVKLVAIVTEVLPTKPEFSNTESSTNHVS